MDRRDIIKAVSGSAVAVVAGQSAAAPGSPVQANGCRRGIGVKDIAPTSANFFIADRFIGKTWIVTGCARHGRGGIGRTAAVSARTGWPDAHTAASTATLRTGSSTRAGKKDIAPRACLEVTVGTGCRRSSPNVLDIRDR